MSHFFRRPIFRRDNGFAMEFAGKHYETGTITNALQAAGVVNPSTRTPYSEALILGASGGIAFGSFVFEYKGALPHASLLFRNTFAPFERALDNMAIRREVRETVKEEKGEENLRRALDEGLVPLVWADIFSLPHKGLCNGSGMWMAVPMAVVGLSDGDYLVADRPGLPSRVSVSDLLKARGVVKKDRFRIATFEAPDTSRLGEGLRRGIETALALYLDKPPAGSANNWGRVGMRHLASLLVDPKNPKGWTKQFEPGPRLVQALAGFPGQPGVWDWIETWGFPSAERGAYASFLREASSWTGLDLSGSASFFDRLAPMWSALAETALSDSVPEFVSLKALKGLYRSNPSPEVRSEIISTITAARESTRLAEVAGDIRLAMSTQLLEIAELEEEAFLNLKSAVSGYQQV